MVVSLVVWARDGRSWVIEAPTYGQAFDLATEAGAVRALDGNGWIDRWLFGEWVGVCRQPHPADVALKKQNA